MKAKTTGSVGPTLATDGPELLTDLATQINSVLTEFGMDQDRADQLACSVTQHIAEHWGGQNLYIPKGHQFRISTRDREIWLAFNGRNHADLARRFGLTVSWLYRILKRVRNAETAHRQLTLF